MTLIDQAISKIEYAAASLDLFVVESMQEAFVSGRRLEEAVLKETVKEVYGALTDALSILKKCGSNDVTASNFRSLCSSIENYAFAFNSLGQQILTHGDVGDFGITPTEFLKLGAYIGRLTKSAQVIKSGHPDFEAEPGIFVSRGVRNFLAQLSGAHPEFE